MSFKLHIRAKTFPRYWHAHSPHRFTVPPWVSCVLLMFDLDLSYRDMEEWLLATDQVRQALGLREVPDHTTLYRTCRRVRLKQLDQLRQALLAELKPEEDILAADATCYQLTNASEYFLTRRGHPRREWRKGIYAVGTQTQLILAWRQSSRIELLTGDNERTAAALAQVDVGIAMGAAGTDIAVEAAHVALMRADWALVPEVLRIARRTMGVVKMNLAFTAVYNIAGLALAALGFLPPVFAAAAQSLPDLGIMANSARLLRQH